MDGDVGDGGRGGGDDDDDTDTTWRLKTCCCHRHRLPALKQFAEHRAEASLGTQGSERVSALSISGFTY